MVRFDVALLAYKVLEILYDEQESSLKPMFEVFDVCLTFNDLKKVPHTFIIKSILQFLSDFSIEYRYNFELGIRVFDYCLRIMDQSSELQPNAAELFSQVASKLRRPLQFNLFENALNMSIRLLDNTIHQSVMENIVAGLFILTKNYSSEEEIATARSHCFNLVQSRLSTYLQAERNNSADNLQLYCTLKVVLACFSSLESCSHSTILMRQLSSLKNY